MDNEYFDKMETRVSDKLKKLIEERDINFVVKIIIRMVCRAYSTKGAALMEMAHYLDNL